MSLSRYQRPCIIQVANVYGYDIPTATINRKVTATAVKESDTATTLAIHCHMSHAPETSMKSYQFLTIEDSVDTNQTIKQLHSRKYFLEEEDRKLLKGWPLQNGATPSLKICRGLVTKYGLPRTAKQLQDWWKTLAEVEVDAHTHTVHTCTHTRARARTHTNIRIHTFIHTCRDIYIYIRIIT